MGRAQAAHTFAQEAAQADVGGAMGRTSNRFRAAPPQIPRRSCRELSGTPYRARIDASDSKRRPP
eukprot:11157246-Lingulodinium_polyedra.AAC.1